MTTKRKVSELNDATLPLVGNEQVMLVQSGGSVKADVSDLFRPGEIVGWNDYNDTTGSISVPADTWTDLPNNGLGSFTNQNYPPEGINELIDVNTGYIDPTELSLGDVLLIRNDYLVTPQTNNTAIRFRFFLGAGAGQYPLEKREPRMDEGSGIAYPHTLGAELIYMGDTNTRNNPIKLQVKVSSPCTVLNNGSVIVRLKH